MKTVMNIEEINIVFNEVLKKNYKFIRLSSVYVKTFTQIWFLYS